MAKRCKAITSNGSRCKNNAVDGSEYCHIPSHQEKIEEIDYDDMSLEELKDHMTDKQAIFADEYIITTNATQAAIKAGYSENTARQQGSENLSKPVIANYVKRRLEEKEDELIAEQDEILKFFTAVMRNDLNYLKAYEPTEIKDRIKAAEDLAKTYALFKDKVEHSGDVGVNIINDIPKSKPSKD